MSVSTISPRPDQTASQNTCPPPLVTLGQLLAFSRATARSVNPGPPKRERDSHLNNLMREGRVPRRGGGRLIGVARLLQEVIPSPGAAEKHKSWDDLHTAAKRSWLGDKDPFLLRSTCNRICYADWPVGRTGLAHRTNRPAGQGYDTIRYPNPANASTPRSQPPT